METLDLGLDAIERVLSKHKESRHLVGTEYVIYTFIPASSVNEGLSPSTSSFG